MVSRVGLVDCCSLRFRKAVPPLIGSQSFMLVAAAALAGLAFADVVTPVALLGLIFAVGAGQTLTSPTWQTLQPELVAPEDRPQPIALGSVNQNLSRAVGPAIGGALYAATSAAVLFSINALSFVPVIGAVARWRGRARPASAAGPEHVGPAVSAGARYVAASPALRVILLRAGVFMLFANSIWALFPLVAREHLHLGSGGYGPCWAAWASERSPARQRYLGCAAACRRPSY